jgi:protein-tyrosine kinase
MSRIDEAMRRVAGVPKAGSEHPTPVVVERRLEASLDRFVAERSDVRLAPSAQLHSRMKPAGAPAPRLHDRAQIPMLHPELDGKLVVSREISSLCIEQYRRLAATLHDLQQQRQVKSLMVSSAVPLEGKTLTITNLALTLSESYNQRVLLIDADLRRPSIHEVFGLPIGIGLGDVLRSESGTLPHIEVSPRLCVLTAGRHGGASPLAQLTSGRLPAILELAARDFSWILVDTPPIGLLPDAQHVARVCDGVLFVIGSGATSFRVVQRSVAELGADRVVGVILNRADPSVLSVHDYGNYYAGDTK